VQGTKKKRYEQGRQSEYTQRENSTTLSAQYLNGAHHGLGVVLSLGNFVFLLLLFFDIFFDLGALK
jgi:hypothetical protein